MLVSQIRHLSNLIWNILLLIPLLLLALMLKFILI